MVSLFNQAKKDSQALEDSSGGADYQSGSTRPPLAES